MKKRVIIIQDQGCSFFFAYSPKILQIYFDFYHRFSYSILVDHKYNYPIIFVSHNSAYGLSNHHTFAPATNTILLCDQKFDLLRLQSSTDSLSFYLILFS